jgi:hypothetical protein
MGHHHFRLLSRYYSEVFSSGILELREVFFLCHEAGSIVFPCLVVDALLSVVATVAVVSVSGVSHLEFYEVISCHLKTAYKKQF